MTRVNLTSLKRLFRLIGLLAALGALGCEPQGRELPVPAGDEKKKSAQPELSAADCRCAELAAQTPPLPDRVPVFRRDVAEHALKLVDAECWKEAAALLEKLSDLDFIVPAYDEIVDIDENGAYLVEPIREHAIGNRHAALVRCYYHLGRLQDTRSHVWKAFEDARFEPTCFHSIVELNHDELDTVVQRAKSILADEPHNTAAEMLLEYVALVHLLDDQRFDRAIDTTTFGCSCPGDDSLGSSFKDAYDRLAAETIAQQGDVVVPHLVAKLQPSPDSVHSCIVYALELCPDERGQRALVTARKSVRNYGMGKRLEQAIARIRQELEDAPD